MSHIKVTYQDVTVSYHIMKSHDECGRVAHRLCSSCISSIQNSMRIPLTSPCQTWSVIKLPQAKSPHIYFYSLQIPVPTVLAVRVRSLRNSQKLIKYYYVIFNQTQGHSRGLNQYPRDAIGRVFLCQEQSQGIKVWTQISFYPIDKD